METLNKNKHYQVHPEDVDVRDWDVLADGNLLGVVDDLVLDTGNMRVKYLDLIRKNKLEDTTYHYLIPVDQVTFNRHNKTVNLGVDPHHFHNTYPGYSNEIPDDYEERVRRYYMEAYTTRVHTDNPPRRYDKDDISKNKTTATEVVEKIESPYGSEYEKIKNKPTNWKRKIEALERQKQLKKIELERDIALIDEEINQIKGRA